jgi:hypothetical protein
VGATRELALSRNRQCSGGEGIDHHPAPTERWQPIAGSHTVGLARPIPCAPAPVPPQCNIRVHGPLRHALERPLVGQLPSSVVPPIRVRFGPSGPPMIRVLTRRLSRTGQPSARSAYPAATPHCEAPQVASTVAWLGMRTTEEVLFPPYSPPPSVTGPLGWPPGWPSAALPRRRSTLWSPVPSTVAVQTCPAHPVRAIDTKFTPHNSIGTPADHVRPVTAPTIAAET